MLNGLKSVFYKTIIKVLDANWSHRKCFVKKHLFTCCQPQGLTQMFHPACFIWWPFMTLALTSELLLEQQNGSHHLLKSDQFFLCEHKASHGKQQHLLRFFCTYMNRKITQHKDEPCSWILYKDMESFSTAYTLKHNDIAKLLHPSWFIYCWWHVTEEKCQKLFPF